MRYPTRMVARDQPIERMYTVVAAMRKGLVINIRIKVRHMLTLMRPFAIGQFV